MGVAVGALLAAGEARAQSSDIEVGPWLGWGAGQERQYRLVRDIAWLSAGFDVTAPVSFLGSPYGGPIEIRLGPWGALELPMGRNPAAEGGLTLVATQVRHASFGTYGVRFGVGHGAGDVNGPVTYLTGTLFGGVRYVPARTGRVQTGLFTKATGLRITATWLRDIQPIETEGFLIGVEFEPEWLLPPYEPRKWGGAH